MQTIRDLNPIWFVRESWRFMSDVPRREFWIGLPLAYLAFCRETLRDGRRARQS